MVEVVGRGRIASWLGLTGVADNECRTARRIGKKFEFPMVLLAFWIIFEWYASNQGDLDPEFHRVSDWVVWLFFLTETIVLTCLVNDKKNYLTTNWMNVLIIVAGLPIVWDVGNLAPALRSLRLLLIFSLLLPLLSSVREVLARNNLGITLLVSFIFILMSGLLIAGIDPSIDTVWDGLWWAWVTVTTVGYGDLVPSSVIGKIFGALLILMGLGLFSMITASFSAYFYAKEDAIADHGDSVEFDEHTGEVLDHLEARLAVIEGKLDKLLRQQH